jgi:hypothetical protein
MVHKVLKVALILEQQVHKVLKVALMLEQQVILVHKVILVIQEIQALKVHKVPVE